MGVANRQPQPKNILVGGWAPKESMKIIWDHILREGRRWKMRCYTFWSNNPNFQRYPKGKIQFSIRVSGNIMWSIRLQGSMFLAAVLPEQPHLRRGWFLDVISEKRSVQTWGTTQKADWTVEQNIQKPLDGPCLPMMYSKGGMNIMHGCVFFGKGLTSSGPQTTY